MSFRRWKEVGQAALLAVVLLALPPAVHAVVNVEELRYSGGDEGLSGELDLGYALKRGNTEVSDLSASGIVGSSHGAHLAFLIGDISYGQQGGSIYENSRMAHLRYNYRFTSHWAGESYVQAEQDEFRLLAGRYLLGAGLRWQGGEPGPLRFAFGLGLFEEWMLYDVPADAPAGFPDSEQALRGSSYLVVNWRATETASLNLIGYLQPVLSDPEDLRATAESSLRVKISEHLALAVSLNFRYDSDPVERVEPYDLVLKNSLSISF